jgi:hypothetical protein
MARGPKTGFDEAQGKYAADALSSVLAAYDFACAFTGRDLRTQFSADPLGFVLNLSGDPLTSDRTLLIPATHEAVLAFERGHLALGPNYNFLVDLEHIDPEFLERLNPIGRLRLPTDLTFAPSQAALTPHLIAFATGRRRRR